MEIALVSLSSVQEPVLKGNPSLPPMIQVAYLVSKRLQEVQLNTNNSLGYGAFCCDSPATTVSRAVVWVLLSLTICTNIGRSIGHEI